MSPVYNDLNFAKRGCEGSLDIVVISVVLVFPAFLLVSALQNGRFEPPKFWGTDFRGGTTNNKSAKTIFGDNLVEIRPAVARAVASNEKSQNGHTKTSPSLAERGAV